MSNLKSRIERLELLLPKGRQPDQAFKDVLGHLQEIYSRLTPKDITEERMGRESA